MNERKGASLFFHSGAGKGNVPELTGDIHFCLGGTEILRFEGDGKIYLRGKLIDNDREFYANFREWLSCARMEVRRKP